MNKVSELMLKIYTLVVVLLPLMQQNLLFYNIEQQVIVRTSNRVDRRTNRRGITRSQKTSQCYVSLHDVLHDLFLCL